MGAQSGSAECRVAAVALAAAIATLIASAPSARAGGTTRKVDIETDPPGAKIYLNDVDQGAVCEATPCTIDAPIGQTPIIVRLDKFEPIIDALDVPKKKDKKPIVVKFRLKSAIGTIVIDTPAAKGATVKIDEVDKGKVPAHVDVDSGPHHVVVAMAGKTLFDDFVNVDTGEEVPITPKPATVVATKDADPDAPVTDDDSGSDSGGKIVKQRAATPAHTPMAAVGVAFDIGARHVKYANPTKGPVADEDEAGQALAGPAIEVWPTLLLGLDRLAGLSLFFKIEFPVNHQTVVDKMNHPVGPTTSWTSLEASVRHRWTIVDTVAITASGGFVRDQLQFTGVTDMVPDADYKSVRLGLRGSLIAAVEPYVEVETRLVLSGGVMPSRFGTASASGLRAALGVAARFGPIVGRLEGSVLQYSWDFQFRAGATADASGATDRVLMASAIVGYAF